LPAVAPFEKVTSVIKSAYPAPGVANTSNAVWAPVNIPLYFTA